MEYSSKVKKFVVHKSYTDVLSDITAVEKKMMMINKWSSSNPIQNLIIRHVTKLSHMFKS